MPRLQILELPEGSNDDQPPFLLVVDQVNADAAEAIANAGLTTAELIGARAVLVFEETVDIPANDTSAYLGKLETTTELQNQLDEARQWARHGYEIGQRHCGWADHGVAPDWLTEGWPPHIDSCEHLKHAAELEEAEAARKRVATECKAALADALGTDRLRDWDDIRNAAAGLRKQRDDQAAELERLHTGEEPVTDERVAPTPGQWIWKWNRVTPEKRLDMAAQILDNMPIARNCFMNDHEAQIERLRAEVERLRGELDAGTPNA